MADNIFQDLAKLIPMMEEIADKANNADGFGFTEEQKKEFLRMKEEKKFDSQLSDFKEKINEFKEMLNKK